MNNLPKFHIREAKSDEFEALGELMVTVYSQLPGFPKQDEQPVYYQMLANIGKLTENPGTRILVAVNDVEKIGGGVVYIADMQYYGSGGTATQERNAAGFRLLAVDPATRGQGLGKKLTQACIQLAKDEGQQQIVIHSTEAMQVAWKMYERMGFERSLDLDFLQKGFPVFGFRLKL
jgi:GNAT superfamily N-acetyltransferase